MGKKGSLNITSPGQSVVYSPGQPVPVISAETALTRSSRMRDVLPAQSTLETESDSRPEKSISAFRSILPQILAVNVKNVLLFGYGMTLGFPTILIPAILGGEGRESTMDNKLHLSKEEISWLSSINLICVPLGCIFSGSLAQPLGRRRAMQFVNIPILAAWLCFHFSTEVTHLYAGLCLAGLSGGLLEAPVLTYVAEVTTPRVRGLLAASGSFCAILGVFVQFLLGTFLKWRLIALISVAAPIISFVLLFFVPESPHWLIQKNRLEDAKLSLAWLRGWTTVESVQAEYEVIYANVTKNFGQRDNSCSGKLSGYKQRSFLWPYTIITICFFIGHFSGMTTLQTYAVQIFNTLKAPIDKYYATMLLGLAELLGTFICILLVHYTGKRPIVLISTLGCGFCFLGTATYAYFLNEIPGASISNIVANSSDIFSRPLHAVVAFNETDFSNENMGEDMETENPFVYALYRNESYEFVADDSAMMNFGLANEQERDDNSTVMVAISDEVTTTTYDILYGNRSSVGKVEPKLDMVDPIPANVPERFLLPVTKHAENKFLWVPLTLLLGSAVLSHAGIRLIPWMLIGEIYPTAVRGGASGLSGGTGYIFGFLSNKLFLKLLSTLTLPGTFWMYSAVSLCGAGVLYFILPETEGRSLVDIEEHFTGGRKLEETQPKKDMKKIKNKNMLGNPDSLSETVDGLKGNFRRSCEVSNAANQHNCSSIEAGDKDKGNITSGVERSGVAIVVPDKRSESESIGNTLPPIMNPLGAGRNVVAPRIYVEFHGDNDSSEGDDNGGIDDGKGEDNPTKFNGSEHRRSNSRNDKLFEEAIEARPEGVEWLRRIKDAHNLQLDQHHVQNMALGMKKKRITSS